MASSFFGWLSRENIGELELAKRWLVCYIVDMEMPINLEETPGKVVGKRRPSSNPLDPKAHKKASAEAWRRAFGNGGLPKGVYKFHSHEEADAWLWKMLTRKKN